MLWQNGMYCIALKTLHISPGGDIGCHVVLMKKIHFFGMSDKIINYKLTFHVKGRPDITGKQIT